MGGAGPPSSTCYINGHDISGNGVRLLPHPLLRRRKPRCRFHLEIGCWLVVGGEDVPARGDGVQDQRGQRSSVVQDQPLVFF